MVKMPTYTTESLQKYSIQELKTLHGNALRLGATNVSALVEAELLRRKPPAKTQQKTATPKAAGPVVGFHFVCPKELGVTINPDGTFLTGIWVVAPQQADRALAAGAYVALHNTKAEASYRQGIITGWSPRARNGKAISSGIEFIVQPTSTALEWQGNGSGERGYFYGDDK